MPHGRAKERKNFSFALKKNIPSEGEKELKRDGQKEMYKRSKAKAEFRHTKMKGYKREEFFKGSSQPNAVQRLRFPPMKEKRWMSCLDGGLITSLPIRGAYGSNWSLVPNGIFKHFYYQKKKKKNQTYTKVEGIR